MSFSTQHALRKTKPLEAPVTVAVGTPAFSRSSSVMDGAPAGSNNSMQSLLSGAIKTNLGKRKLPAKSERVSTFRK